VGSILLVSPSANLIIRVRDHTSASSAGAGPMELVSMACPSVVRGLSEEGLLLFITYVPCMSIFLIYTYIYTYTLPAFMLAACLLFLYINRKIISG
jgi:hypothetical protein